MMPTPRNCEPFGAVISEGLERSLVESVIVLELKVANGVMFRRMLGV